MIYDMNVYVDELLLSNMMLFMIDDL